MTNNDSVLTALGQDVRKTREIEQLTQEKLAEFASLDPTYISAIERGLRNPGIKNVAKIAKALGITTSELCKVVEARARDPRKNQRWRRNFRPRLRKNTIAASHNSSQGGSNVVSLHPSASYSEIGGRKR